jgi:hypothetical protein
MILPHDKDGNALEPMHMMEICEATPDVPEVSILRSVLSNNI